MSNVIFRASGRGLLMSAAMSGFFSFALGFASVMASLAAGYYVKVGRLESKGRPRSD